GKTTLPPRPPPKRPSGRKTVPPKNKRPTPKPTTGKTTTKNNTTRKLSTSRPSKRPNKTSSRPVTKASSRITTKKPVIPAKKPLKPTKRPAKTTKKHERTTTTSTPSTSKPTFPATITEASSISASTSPISTTNPSTFTETLSTSSPTSPISTTIPPTTTQNSDIYANEKDALINEINFARQLHRAGEVTVNDELAKKAQELTDESALKRQFVPFKNDTVGLLTYQNREEYNEDFGFSRWTAGADTFDFRKPENNLHHYSSFTQLVWAESKNIGCGISKNERNEIFVACLFYPKGNIPGKYSQNVHEKDPDYYN
uniref:SCP domain-containing protein n=1 Tax=Strongyloides papillosus TaxID=174720 RepID=A0A0N5CBN2_STREA